MNDMACEQGLEETEEYYMMVSKTFKSEAEAYQHYNEHAWKKGFGIRKDNKSYKDTGLFFRRRYVCSKRGYMSQKNFQKTNRKRKPKALSRCGCKAYLQVELNLNSGEWFVRNFEDCHNHPFTKPDQTPFLWSHRGMTDAQKAEAVDYAVGGLRTHQIMEVMEKHVGNYKNLGFIIRDLYNFVAEEKKEMINGLDAQYLLNYMAAAKERDPDFFFRYSLDSEGHLTNIFWADAQSRLDFEAFGAVTVFDSTYRSNLYKLPFVPFVGLNHHRQTIIFGVGLVSDETENSYVWLLRAFLEAMHQKHPRSVITDGDGAMAKAISSVWPNTDHRLCSWHIEKNMIKHLRKTKLKEFRKFVYHTMDVEEFEKRWTAFKKRFKVKQKDTWINRMYELREKWSGAYTRGRYFLAMQSNQRSESLNSRLHVHLNRTMKLVDLIQHYEHCVSIMRRNEAALDAVASQTVPFTCLTTDPLEISASYIYTPVIFMKVKEQIDKMFRWEVADVANENVSVKYEVSCKGMRKIVTCGFAGSILDSVNCACRKMESEDIPCEHIFSVLNDALFKAASSPEQRQKVTDFLNSILDENLEQDDNSETRPFGPLPAYFSGAPQTWTNKVLDKKKIIPKGNPGKSNKRLKPFHETLKPKKKIQKTAKANNK